MTLVSSSRKTPSLHTFVCEVIMLTEPHQHPLAPHVAIC